MSFYGRRSRDITPIASAASSRDSKKERGKISETEEGGEARNAGWGLEMKTRRSRKPGTHSHHFVDRRSWVACAGQHSLLGTAPLEEGARGLGQERGWRPVFERRGSQVAESKCIPTGLMGARKRQNSPAQISTP